MQTNDKQYYIYLRSTKERIPCTCEEFNAYYHDINLFRQKQQRHGKCVCPEKKRLDCDMDCASCSFRRAGDTVSLDYETTADEDGEEITCLLWLLSPKDGNLYECNQHSVRKFHGLYFIGDHITTGSKVSGRDFQELHSPEKRGSPELERSSEAIRL